MSQTIDGLKFINMTEAAEVAGLSNDRFGRLLSKHLIPNGVRVYNTSKNNKGILICLEDIQLIVTTAIADSVPIIDVVLE